MIVMQKLFDLLASSELVNTKYNRDGKIPESEYPVILGHINLALLELSKRFILRQKEVILQQHPNVRKYFIRSDHSGDESEFDNFTYLLYNEDDPLDDEVIKVTNVYNSLGDDLPINDKYAEYPIMVPETDVLVMTPCIPAERFTVVYQASFNEIPFNDKFNPAKTYIEVPKFITDAILYFVANRVFSGIASNIAEGTTTPGMTYDAKYEIACQKLNRFGLVPESNETGRQFENNGWV